MLVRSESQLREHFASLQNNGIRCDFPYYVGSKTISLKVQSAVYRCEGRAAAHEGALKFKISGCRSAVELLDILEGFRTSERIGCLSSRCCSDDRQY